MSPSINANAKIGNALGCVLQGRLRLDQQMPFTAKVGRTYTCIDLVTTDCALAAQTTMGVPFVLMPLYRFFSICRQVPRVLTGCKGCWYGLVVR